MATLMVRFYFICISVGISEHNLNYVLFLSCCVKIKVLCLYVELNA